MNQDAQTYVSLCLTITKVKQNKSGVLKGHEGEGALLLAPGGRERIGETVEFDLENVKRKDSSPHTAHDIHLAFQQRYDNKGR